MNQQNKLYQRNLIKEKIQDEILNFVYNHPDYKNLIFTGGSCLRKIYGLPRASEDLDFDTTQSSFSLGKFASAAADYFQKQKAWPKPETKIAGNRKTIFFKFAAQRLPPANEAKIALAPNEKIFVRTDFAFTDKKFTNTEVNPYRTPSFSLFILSYDLSTIFAHKIAAFLRREFFKGNKQAIPFKGRDLFDLVWLLQLSARSSFQIRPNWPRAFYLLKEKDKRHIVALVIEKVEQIKRREVLADLAPFIENVQELENFLDSYQSVIKNKLPLV